MNAGKKAVWSVWKLKERLFYVRFKAVSRKTLTVAFWADY